MQNITISNEVISLINQVFEIEEKQKMIEQKNSIDKNVRNLKELLEEGFFQDFGISYYNPIGEDFKDSRTDCDVVENLSNTFENLVIIQVIKPIIRVKQNDAIRIIQRARVVVQSKDTQPKESPKTLQKPKQNPSNKALPQSNIERQKQLKEFVNRQLQLNCSNNEAEKFVKQLSKKSNS
jgi:hypothetical protein